MGSACSSGQAVASSVNEDANGSANKSEPLPPPRPPVKEAPEPVGDTQTHEISHEPIKNGELPTPQPIDEPPHVVSNNGDDRHFQGGAVVEDDADADAELKNIDGGPAQYKLVYFAGLRFRAEPIRLILRYADVPYEEQLVSFSEWPKLKGSTPMGGLPLLHVDNRVLCQANAIARFLAKKYGLLGKTNLESAKVDMFVDAVSDIMNEVGGMAMEQDPGKKSDKWHQLKDDLINPFLDRCIKMLAENDSGWFVGEEATWADLMLSEFLSNLSEKIDSTLLDPYPALQAHINGVRALPHIMEYISERPDAIF